MLFPNKDDDAAIVDAQLLAAEILRDFPSDARVVLGRSTVMSGGFGEGKCLHYGWLSPEITSALSYLLSMPAGTFRQMRLEGG